MLEEEEWQRAVRTHPDQGMRRRGGFGNAQKIPPVSV